MRNQSCFSGTRGTQQIRQVVLMLWSIGVYLTIQWSMCAALEFVIISYLKEQYLEFYVVLTAQIVYSFSVSVLLWCCWLTAETEPQYTFSHHHDCFIAPEQRKYRFLVFQSKQAQMYQRSRKATQKKTTHLIRKIIQQRLVWCLLCAVKDLYILEIYAQITLYKT